jgi:hypothetical protein
MKLFCAQTDISKKHTAPITTEANGMYEVYIYMHIL